MSNEEFPQKQEKPFSERFSRALLKEMTLLLDQGFQFVSFQLFSNGVWVTTLVKDGLEKKFEFDGAMPFVLASDTADNTGSQQLLKNLEQLIDKIDEEIFRNDEWVLPTDITIVERASDEFQKRLKQANWSDENLEIGFREALINAITHGNLGIRKPDKEDVDLSELAREKEMLEHPAKHVFVKLHIDDERLEITVRDEGDGFDYSKVASPISDENLSMPSGRGLYLTKQYFDEIKFNDKGNEITMIKYKDKK